LFPCLEREREVREEEITEWCDFHLRGVDHNIDREVPSEETTDIDDSGAHQSTFLSSVERIQSPSPPSLPPTLSPTQEVVTGSHGLSITSLTARLLDNGGPPVSPMAQTLIPNNPIGGGYGFEVIQISGNGMFGRVVRVIDNTTRELVAISGLLVHENRLLAFSHQLLISSPLNRTSLSVRPPVQPSIRATVDAIIPSLQFVQGMGQQFGPNGNQEAVAAIAAPIPTTPVDDNRGSDADRLASCILWGTALLFTTTVIRLTAQSD